MASSNPQPSDARKERARANRRRMVEAAYRLFSERGWGVPLTAIAEEAGVAVQTLYFTFHTKAALLQEALTLAVLQDDLPLGPHERPWFDAMVAEPDPRRALDMVLEATTPIFSRVAPLAAVFKSGDPEVAAIWEHSEKLRLDGYRVMLEALARKAKPRRGLSLNEATDVMFVLLSPEMYWSLVYGQGWSPQRWRGWVTQTLAEALWGPA
jgi:AcrR family transcriptional regulator